jgi:hypothetical protein
MLLQDIETILGKSIEFTDEEDNFKLYIRRAITIIKNYLNNPTFTNEYIEANFPDAIIEIVVFAYRNKGQENIKSTSQGARSITYSDGSVFAISDSVRQLLPHPYIRMW